MLTYQFINYNNINIVTVVRIKKSLYSTEEEEEDEEIQCSRHWVVNRRRKQTSL